MRKVPFATGEYYHVYNRGVDKRITFLDNEDLDRFYTSMEEFNTLDPIGSIYASLYARKFRSPTSKSETDPLVTLVAHCTNPNHFHLLLRQEAERGIEKFMQRVGTGYTKYFNNKHERSGALFQGKFKSVHVDSNEYLLHLSAYVSLNDHVHQLGSPTSELVRSRSSWGEYIDPNVKGICEKSIILDQFKDGDEYATFALESLESIIERKKNMKEIEAFLLEELGSRTSK